MKIMKLIIICLIFNPLVFMILINQTNYKDVYSSKDSQSNDQENLKLVGLHPQISIIKKHKSNDPSPPAPIPSENVGIVVDNSIWTTTNAKNAILQYQLDLNYTGYETLIHTNIVNNVSTLKNILQSWYSSFNIVGAVLIGDLPYAKFYHPASSGFSAESFVCDLYLMDLDGSWWDLNSDGVFDKHNASSGNDIYPEIYIGRIDASNRTLGTASNAQNIANLVNRLHSYRTGGVSRSHKAVSYIDDDWQAYANGTYGNWPNDMNGAYNSRTDIHTPTTSTTATNWLTRLSQDYEFAHLCVHSGTTPGTHYFGPGGIGEGTLTSNNIHSTGQGFNFYNLFCCHGADWLTLDCLATTYLFSGGRTVSVVGSSKTGGMFQSANFYNALGNNDTIGKSLHRWFQNMDSYASNYIEWFYGLSILGDPFATISYDCSALPPQISSSTHISETTWYTANMPVFNWTVPDEVNSIAGYYYIIDQNPTTIPTASTGTYTPYNGTRVSNSLSSGTWYIHLVSKDSVGNIGTSADHYQVNIDNMGPSVSITNPLNGVHITQTSIEIRWTAIDSMVGYSHSTVWFENSSNYIYGGPNKKVTIGNLTIGSHIVNITVFDYFSNINSAQITFYIDAKATADDDDDGGSQSSKSQKIIPSFPIEILIFGQILTIGTILALINNKNRKNL